MEKDYPWYSLVDGAETILQGDFIHECPVLIPPAEFSVGDEIEVSVVNYNVVVMSQSCDLVQGKIDLVLVCPVWPLSEFENRSDFFKSKRGKEALRQGNVPGYHLLNKCEIEGFQQNYLVVDFRSVYGIPAAEHESGGPRGRPARPRRRLIRQAGVVQDLPELTHKAAGRVAVDGADF